MNSNPVIRLYGESDGDKKGIQITSEGAGNNLSEGLFNAELHGVELINTGIKNDGESIVNMSDVKTDAPIYNTGKSIVKMERIDQKITQNHYGVGDNILGDKILSNKETKNNSLKSIVMAFYPVVIVIILVGFLGWKFTSFSLLGMSFSPKSSKLEDNIMSITQNHYGTGDNIAGDKITINPKESPTIIESQIISSEAYLDGYKTRFEIVAGNPSASLTLDVKTSSGSRVYFIDPLTQLNSGTRVPQNGSINYKSFSFSLFTDKKLNYQDFTFSLKEKE